MESVIESGAALAFGSMSTRAAGTILSLVLFSAAAACAGKSGGAVEELPPRPLAGMLAQPLLVLPAHYLRGGDSIGWTARISDSRAFLAGFDSVLERTLRARGAPDSWRFPPELQRMAQRNPGYVANPYQLAAQGLRPPARPANGQLTDPLASQIRAWVALNQGRMALFPIEIRFEGTRDSAQAVVRLAILDARLSRVSWMADIRGDFGKEPAGEVVASLARQVADLAAPP
jgi:hypothetical protein